jgi:serine/threonine protein phosphatase 1
MGRRPPEVAPPPGDGPLFVVGDVHGCSVELGLLLDQLPLTRASTVVFVGDYLDRGDGSRQVVETILRLRERCAVVPLLGNHEAMFLDFYRDPRSLAGGMFIYNGGSTTLASYANELGEYDIPEAHLEFIRQLPLTYETRDHLFVHAGLPERPLAELAPEEWRDEMLWTRAMGDSTYRWEKVVVHGHCHVASPVVADNHVNVDTGCVYGGSLSALELRTGKVYSVTRRQPEAPRHLRDIRSRRRAIRFEGSIPVCIDVAGQLLHFLTVNYSEIGMYLRALVSHTEVSLAVGDQVTGYVGVPGPWLVRFWGIVVRSDEGPGGSFYAIEITAAVGA